ncbi:MAG: molecular chaperone HtpG [Ardenticatenales bacterium]|nr:molecular chaperone HtpG [Ardenticatenales bacterium]
MTTAETNAYQYKAEIKQLLEILVHSLYKEPEIFLREMISNASDALTRLHFETLTNENIHDAGAPLEIRLTVEKPEEDEEGPSKIIIKDTGIGMTEQELITNLGTIAQSGAREFLAELKKGESDIADMIGQFGVGFYSVFMVADEVRVVSRSYRPDAEPAAWVSTGDDSFRIEPADKSDRGTEIHITLKESANEFATEWKLKQVIKTHSDYISYPIYVGDEQANQQTSLWRQSASEVEEEAYKQFYQTLTMDFEEPLAHIHFASDAPVHIRSLLFVPPKREKSMFAARKEPGVKLYTNNVLIQEYCTDLLPKWLDFVDGVVDSEDLPLNVSRETVQNNRLMRQLARMVKGRVLRTLRDMAKDEPEKYEQFWKQYSRVLKEGLATDFAAKEDILPLYRVHSSKSDGKLISLEDYIGRMPEEQEHIYYVLGDDLRSVTHSPHMDPFKARDIEVLYWVDPLDVFVAPMLNEYEGKQLKNISDADIDLPEAAEDADAESESKLEDKAFNLLVSRAVKLLGEKVTEVRASKVLKDSPIRLVAPEDAPNREMERIQRYMDQAYEVPARIMEINRSHELIMNLAHKLEANENDPVVDLVIEQLYNSALIQEGLHPNPAEMLPRIQELMRVAVGE